MFHRFISIIVISFFISIQTFASERVEDIFQDIESDYKYLYELQYLYDNNIIEPNIHGKFDPKGLLTREEFVGILLETNCTDCVKPKTNFDLIQKYQNNSVYYDVYNNTNYFYCISEADSKNFIQGYEVGTQCENGEGNIGEIPFCPYNTIILEEALAIVMRAGNILSQQQADDIISNILNGEGNYPILSEDVQVRNLDNSPYNFYPYFYKAENFNITEYNNFGQRKDFSLIKKIDNKYNPKRSVNREDFLQLATFSLKNSNCIEKDNQVISGLIDIYESSCGEDKSTCEYKNNYVVEEPINIFGNIDTDCPLGFGNNQDQNYNWVIHNLKINTEEIYTGKNLDNFVFKNSGEYKIDLYITDLCGNNSFFSKTVNVSGGDNENFSLSAIYEKEGGNVINFSTIVQGDNGPYTYEWNFGDGNISTLKNPIHNYDEIGIFDVTLTVTDSNGVKKVTSLEVNLYDMGFDIAIKFENNIIGGPYTFDFFSIVNSNNPNLKYNWNFGNNDISTEKNPTYNFPGPGKYKVILTVIDEFGNSKLVETMISIGSGSFDVDISNKFLSSTLIDFESSVDGGVGPFTYEWDFGDGNTSGEQNPNYNYEESGIYTVILTVTDTNGGVSIKEVQITIGEGNFSSTIIYSDTIDPFEYNFEGIVFGGVGPFTYEWDFGDGNTSGDKNPTHIFTQPGEYIVRVVITDSDGNIQINTVTIIIGNDQFYLNISSDSNDGGIGVSEVIFTSRVDGGVGPFIYEWDFGDGNTSLEQNPLHTFTQPGVYDVILRVIDSNGNIQITTTQIFVGEATMDLFINSDPTNNPGEFIFTSRVDGGVGPFTYEWNFGDGNTSSQQNPIHTYLGSGTYTVVLTIIDSNGNRVSRSISIIVVVSGLDNGLMNISINASPTQGPGPLASTFSAFVNGGVGPYNYEWDFGDGNQGFGRNISHVFSEVGTYDVMINIVDSNGKQESQGVTINVTQGDIQGLDPNSDSDNDGVLDINDKCINIVGIDENDGCPVFETQCGSDSDCPENSKCGSIFNGISTCVPIAFSSSCEYDSSSTVFGNVVCNTCPCDQTLDFNALLRNCDVVFPAITSQDGKEIFSQGNYYQIKK